MMHRAVFGEGRGFRVVWLLEEMGLPYKLRPVDLLAGVENDPEYLAVNPAGFIPALRDGDATMVESIAIMEYLMARYGPTPLAPHPLVSRQLARSPYLAGDAFTAADISVTYALQFAQRTGAASLGEAEQAYVARTGARDAYKRAMDVCRDTKAWAAEAAATRE